MTHINIGLEEKERFGSAELLNRLLADEFVLCAKTRNYHWNVTGIRFNDLHRFFESQYKQLDELMDSAAERVRMLGFYAKGSLEQYIKLSHLKEPIGDLPEALEMLKNLLDDHETIIRHLRQAVNKDDTTYHDSGTADFLTGIMETHEKMAWMLRSYLQN